MGITKHWSEILTGMTIDENGKIKATEENELKRMTTEEFFIKLSIYKEVLDERLSQLNKIKK